MKNTLLSLILAFTGIAHGQYPFAEGEIFMSIRGETSNEIYKYPAGVDYLLARDTDGSPLALSYDEVQDLIGLNNVENTAISTWPGSSSITTLGTVTTGMWNGSPITNTYISSATTWNAKIGGSTGANNNALLRADGTGGSTLKTSIIYADNDGRLGVGINNPQYALSFGTRLATNGDKLALYESDGAFIYGFGVTPGSVDFYAGGVQTAAFKQHTGQHVDRLATGAQFVGTGVMDTPAPTDGIASKGAILVLNTWSSTTNYEALSFDWLSNVGRIRPTVGSGAGTARPIEYHTTTTGVRLMSGSGSPESVVSAPVGSLYMRTDGGANTTIYVKESGTGNTGWIAK